MKIELPIGQVVTFVPAYEPGVNYEAIIVEHEEVDCLLTITKRITNQRPSTFKHSLGARVRALDHEVFPIFRGPDDIEAYLAT